jgi:hypothetical protein
MTPPPRLVSRSAAVQVHADPNDLEPWKQEVLTEPLALRKSLDAAISGFETEMPVETYP